MRAIKMSWKLWSVAALAVVVIIVLAMRGCGGSVEKEYRYDSVEKGDVKRTISVTGVLEVVDPVRILAKTNGMVEKVYVDYNSVVKKGQRLAVIEASDLQRQSSKMAAQIESLSLKVNSTKAQVESKKNLYNDNLISKQAMEQAQMEYRTALSELKQARLDYNIIRKQLGEAVITSPTSGIVISKKVDEKIPVSGNTLIFIIAPTLDKMHLIINIDESDIGTIKEKMDVTFTVSAYPDEEFSGEIAQVRMEPVRKGGLVTYQALVTCRNRDTMLKPGMTATATIMAGFRKEVLRASNQAFIVSPEGEEYSVGTKVVWLKSGVLGEGQHERREVKTGLVGDRYTEIIEGVSEGDDVLVQILEKEE